MDPFCRRIVWPLWARRDDRRLPAFVAELERRQWDPPPVQAARQAVMLRRMVRHAATTVPYYRDLFRTLRLAPDDIRGPDDLQALPVLTKATVRKCAEELLSDRFRAGGYVTKKTSGSTGVPLRVRLDDAGLAWKRAATLRADEWSGWHRGGRVAKAWGNPEYRQFGFRGWLRNAMFERAIHLDTLHMDRSDLRHFAERMIRFRPRLIFGHAHSVYLLAQFAEQESLALPRPDGIITTAMILHDFQRQLIERVLGTKVTNRYGCEEVSLIACECPAHRGLHVNADSVLVEILDDGRPVTDGRPGAVFITDLSNFAMPLLRYAVGDVAGWAQDRCPCGRPGARLARIEGREADYVVTANGTLISGISLTENFATLVPGVAQLQIVQETVTEFRFRIVRAAGFDERRLEELVRERFGPQARFGCEFVESIPAEPSGKYRFCISHVHRLGGRAA